MIGAKSVYEVDTDPGTLTDSPQGNAAGMTREETQRWVQGEGW